MNRSSSRPSVPRNCDFCGEEYQAHLKELRRGWGLHCSKSCSIRSRRKAWPASRIWVKRCEVCTALFTAHHASKTICGDLCRAKRQSAQTSKSIMKRYNNDPAFRDKVIAAAQARRAEKLGLGSLQVSLEYLGQRDRWTCQLCHEPVPRDEASIDHIIPLSKGGTHDLANVHLAHRSCNARKNNRAMNEQLLVFG